MYVHVPAAWISLASFSCIAILSILNFIFKIKSFTLLTKSIAPIGLMFTCIAIVTGSIWGQPTWGTFWVNDPKLNGTAVTLLIYLAYFILRNSIENEDSKARVSAIYNIIAFVMMIVFIGVLPRMTDSLHPGNGGNPAFGNYDLDSNMRMVFYPAVIGWILIGSWIAQLRFRIKLLEINKENI